jgi:hypothetical protein
MTLNSGIHLDHALPFLDQPIVEPLMIPLERYAGQRTESSFVRETVNPRRRSTCGLRTRIP